MKVIFDGTESEPFDPVTDLRVLVAYLNAAFRPRVNAMLQRVGEAVGKAGPAARACARNCRNMSVLSAALAIGNFSKPAFHVQQLVGRISASGI